MKLIAAVAVLGLVVIVGFWLAGQYVLMERPPARRWPGAVHGAAGLAGAALLAAALAGPPPTARARHLGAGGFGLVSGALIAGALIAGSAIALAHLRRRPVSTTLVATHGLLGIAGYTLLATYLTMLR
jgi:hypothetical protein